MGTQWCKRWDAGPKKFWLPKIRKNPGKFWHRCFDTFVLIVSWIRLTVELRLILLSTFFLKNNCRDFLEVTQQKKLLLVCNFQKKVNIFARDNCHTHTRYLFVMACVVTVQSQLCGTLTFSSMISLYLVREHKISLVKVLLRNPTCSA